jgi:hypothetical protein
MFFYCFCFSAMTLCFYLAYTGSSGPRGDGQRSTGTNEGTEKVTGCRRTGWGGVRRRCVARSYNLYNYAYTTTPSIYCKIKKNQVVASETLERIPSCWLPMSICRSAMTRCACHLFAGWRTRRRSGRAAHSTPNVARRRESPAEKSQIPCTCHCSFVRIGIGLSSLTDNNTNGY